MLCPLKNNFEIQKQKQTKTNKKNEQHFPGLVDGVKYTWYTKSVTGWNLRRDRVYQHKMAYLCELPFTGHNTIIINLCCIVLSSQTLRLRTVLWVWESPTLQFYSLNLVDTSNRIIIVYPRVNCFLCSRASTLYGQWISIWQGQRLYILNAHVTLIFGTTSEH